MVYKMSRDAKRLGILLCLYSDSLYENLSESFVMTFPYIVVHLSLSLSLRNIPDSVEYESERNLNFSC